MIDIEKLYAEAAPGGAPVAIETVSKARLGPWLAA